MRSEGGFFASSLGHVLSWARAHSLWYTSTGQGCCADELLNTLGCRYDLERFGCLPKSSAHHSDLLIVCGFVSQKAEPELKKLYETLARPRYVMAVGACACTGGLFRAPESYTAPKSLSEIIPVDVFIPGCPPRPEAIMNGLIALQEKSVGQSA